MAGIRGMKNPFPVKGEKGPSGVFNQKGSGGPFSNKDVLAGSMKSERKGPTGRVVTAPKRGESHYTNQGLKRGTAK